MIEPDDSVRGASNRRGTTWGVLFVAASCAAIPWIRSHLVDLDSPVELAAEVPRVVEPRQAAVMEPTAEFQAATSAPSQPPESARIPERSSPLGAAGASEAGAAGPFAVQINATPWAMVRIDGVDLGATPLANIPLMAGGHAFRAEMADGRVIERDIEIDAENRFIGFE